jgi:hypothetical protein
MRADYKHIRIEGYFFFLLILGFIFQTSCISEEISITDLNLKDGAQYEISIEGGIVSVYGKQLIKLTEPFDINADSVIAINTATVKLSDGTNEWIYQNINDQGYYETLDSIAGEAGKVYTIYVEYNNKTYKASDSICKVLDKSIETLPISELTTGPDGRIYSNITIHNFGFNKPNIWINNSKSKHGKKYLTALTAKQIIFSSSKIYSHTGSLPQGVFPSGFTSFGDAGEPNDTTEYLKLSVSDAYYKYLVSMFNLTDWSSGIFSTIPGNTYSNVSEGGTGFFFASDVKKIRIQYKDLKTID